MSQKLSRRGLFSAFGPERTEDGREARLARLSAACLDEKGVACRRCPEVCDADAILMTLLGAGKARPAISAERCVGCGDCVAVCPVSALALVPRAALAASLADLARQPSGASA